MLHQKATQSFYRDQENDLQFLANAERAKAYDYELYDILAEYDEMNINQAAHQ